MSFMLALVALTPKFHGDDVELSGWMLYMQ